jgi:nucleoside-diphosphate-sugar epimerase
VRDLAAAHILSLDNPAVANQRLLVGGQKFSTQIALDALKQIPELKGRLPADGSEELAEIKWADVEEWNDKLGLKLTPAAETFKDTAKRILELEKQAAQK